MAESAPFTQPLTQPITQPIFNRPRPMQNRNIYPYLVKGKASKKDGSCPISIDIDNKRAVTFSTKKKIHPDQWDFIKQRAKTTASNSILLNASINKRIKELEGELLKKKLLNVSISKIEVRSQPINGSRLSYASFCKK
ncbi:MAG: Arm DNA-binding domain-containing protein [Chitinophagaceae bacterium]